MSLLAMSQLAYARRTDTDRSSQQSGLLTADGTATSAGDGQSPVARAIGAIVAYIPIEVNLLYVAALGTSHSQSSSRSGQWVAFWCFLAATPAVSWLLYAAKAKANGKKLPLSPNEWPYLEAVIAAIAFAIWAAALPDTPFSEVPGYSAGLAGFLVLVFTTLIGLVTPVFARPLRVGSDA